jgi:hypothetical protein
MSGEQEDATPYQRFVGCAHPLNSCARGDSPSKFAGQDLPSTFTCMRLPVDAQPLLARAKGNRIECNLLHCICFAYGTKRSLRRIQVKRNRTEADVKGREKSAAAPTLRL